MLKKKHMRTDPELHRLCNPAQKGEMMTIEEAKQLFSQRYGIKVSGGYIDEDVYMFEAYCIETEEGDRFIFMPKE